MVALLIIAGAVALWHIGAVNGVALYAGSLAAPAWIGPKAVFQSKAHRIGVLSAAIGAFIIWFSLIVGGLGYGLLIGGAFILADAWLIYRACKEWMRSD